MCSCSESCGGERQGPQPWSRGVDLIREARGAFLPQALWAKLTRTRRGRGKNEPGRENSRQGPCREQEFREDQHGWTRKWASCGWRRRQPCGHADQHLGFRFYLQTMNTQKDSNPRDGSCGLVLWKDPSSCSDLWNTFPWKTLFIVLTWHNQAPLKCFSSIFLEILASMEWSQEH